MLNYQGLAGGLATTKLQRSRAIPRVRKLVFMDTYRARNARSVELTERQFSIAVGSLLGDGYLVPTTRGYALRINHSIAQKPHVDWKYKELELFTNTPPRQSSSCYYFRTVSHHQFDQLREAFYCGQRKIAPLRLSDWINPLVLSVWIMDDGAREGNQLRINTQSFSQEENESFIEILKAKLGITATLNRDKDRFRLRVNAASMLNVQQMVAPYIVPSMHYKFSL